MKKILLATLTAMSIISTASGATKAQNPLLVPSQAPHGAVPFDKIQPADYEEAVMLAIDKHNKEIDAIVKQRSTPDFDNTIAALARSGKDLEYVVLTLSNLEHATGDTVLMNIYERVNPAITDHFTSVNLNEGLWQRVKQVYDNRDKLAANLGTEDKRLLQETYLGFVECGANLSPEDREKYRALSNELAMLSLKFGQNVSNELKSEKCRLWLTADQLEGLPKFAVDAARSEAAEVLAAEGREDDGSLYLFTAFAPSYSPFMKYQKDKALREKLYRIYTTRNIGGQYDNTQILKDIANIRLEIANLLGYPTFADYQLQRTMAANPQNVKDFLNQLKDAYTEPMKNELAEIEAFARESEGPDFNLEIWDYSYWSDKLKNAKYAFNDEALKPYFELENTIDGVFGLATKLYGYTFKENKDIPAYHPDMKAYEVYNRDGNLQGILYADFYYRPGKAPGAWMTEFRSESKDDNGVRELPIISMVMNFSKPVGDEPVLLTPYEVETFLHEFGHCLHGLSAEAEYASLAGTNVYHDFVETFSQFNENYMKEKDFLDSFARDHKTGEKMPQELIDKFIQAGQYGAAYACMRQLGFGMLDMAYHTIDKPLRASADIEVFENAAVDPVRTFPAVAGTYGAPNFGHIFSGGYAAGYYGYKWAEMLEADAFAAFLENGIFDRETADKFYTMMSAGGTDDPMTLYVAFRGKKPTVDALLRRDGLRK